jgi:hypothetical protein
MFSIFDQFSFKFKIFVANFRETQKIFCSQPYLRCLLRPVLRLYDLHLVVLHLNGGGDIGDGGGKERRRRRFVEM